MSHKNQLELLLKNYPIVNTEIIGVIIEYCAKSENGLGYVLTNFPDLFESLSDIKNDHEKLRRLVMATTVTSDKLRSLLSLAESREWHVLIAVVDEILKSAVDDGLSLEGKSEEISYSVFTPPNKIEPTLKLIKKEGLILLSDKEKKFDINVVFIHGMNGDPIDTWSNGDSCWPIWLDEDIDRCRVWALAYPSSIFNLSGYTSDLEIIGQSALDFFVDVKIGDKPIVFITHSMGGLVVKKLLFKSRSSENKESQAISNLTKGVIFFATPHKGVPATAWSKHFCIPFLAPTTTEMEPFNNTLTSTNESFQSYVEVESIKGISFLEGKKVRLKDYFPKKRLKWVSTLIPPNFGALIVPTSSAKSGISNIINRHCLSEDHISICKPSANGRIESHFYERVKAFINDLLASDG